jgi:DNA-binding NtrC family response regulator
VVRFILGEEDHDLTEAGGDVLVVDDDAGGTKALWRFCRDSGYVVDTAVTLAEAKQLLAQFRYGVVLADWRLPDGDGSALANLATAAGSHAFVISGDPAIDVTRQRRRTADADEAGHPFRTAGGGACLHRAARSQSSVSAGNPG